MIRLRSASRWTSCSDVGEGHLRRDGSDRCHQSVDLSSSVGERRTELVVDSEPLDRCPALGGLRDGERMPRVSLGALRIEASGVRDQASRLVGLGLLGVERVQAEVGAPGAEEVLLAPAAEHREGEERGVRVGSRGDVLGLVAARPVEAGFILLSPLHSGPWQGVTSTGRPLAEQERHLSSYLSQPCSSRAHRARCRQTISSESDSATLAPLPDTHCSPPPPHPLLGSGSPSSLLTCPAAGGARGPSSPAAGPSGVPAGGSRRFTRARARRALSSALHRPSREGRRSAMPICANLA